MPKTELTELQLTTLNILEANALSERHQLVMLNNAFPKSSKPETPAPLEQAPKPVLVALESPEVIEVASVPIPFRQGAGKGNALNRHFNQDALLRVLNSRGCKSATTVAAAIKMYYEIRNITETDLLALILKNTKIWNEAGIIGTAACDLVRKHLKKEDNHISGAAFVHYAYIKLTSGRWSSEKLETHLRKKAKEIAEFYAKSPKDKLPVRTMNALQYIEDAAKAPLAPKRASAALPAAVQLQVQ